MVPFSLAQQQRLEVVPIGEHDWRVCDSTVDAFDATRLLAYIEERDGHVEVLRISQPRGADTFETLDEALAALASSLAA